jgi:rod shape-determining protein MreD
MIWVISVPLLGLLSVLQSAVFRQIAVLGGNLDLTLLVVLCWSILRPEEGLVWAGVAGIFMDLLSGGPLGATAIAYVIASLAAGQLEGRLWGQHPLVLMGIGLLGTGVSHLLGLALLGLTGRSLDVGYSLTYVTLPTAFVNVACILPVNAVMRWLDRATRPHPAVGEGEE